MSVNDCMAANLKKFRENRKLTQEKLAEMAGCSKNHLSSIERGVKFPSAGLIDKLSNILDIKPFELFQDESDINKQHKRNIVIEYVMDSLDREKLKSLNLDDN